MQRNLVCQPDVPGAARDTVNGPVQFVPQQFGRWIASIGSNPVGSIDPAPWGKMSRSTWRCGLFEGALCYRADSVVKAKVALLRRVADWHDLAGPLYAEHARLIRLQADALSP